MRIHLIAPVYNEYYLLPIFMKNYSYVDKFTFLYDTDTNDDSLDIINQGKLPHQEVEIVPFNTGDGLNDTAMIFLTNQTIKQSNDDYFICVDIDELLFHKGFHFLIKEEIEKSQKNYYDVAFFQMYPHHSEPTDLDENIPIFNQRRYGYLDDKYVKPVIIKNGCDFFLTEGKHTLLKNGEMFIKEKNLSEVLFVGCHLNNVNLEQSIIRRVYNRKNRISAYNKQIGLASHYYDITIESIKAEYEKIYDRIW